MVEVAENLDGTNGPERQTDTGTELEPHDETLDAAIGALEVVLNKHVDARLKTIEVQQQEALAKLETVVTFIEAFATAMEGMKNHPLLGSLFSGETDGFDFG